MWSLTTVFKIITTYIHSLGVCTDQQSIKNAILLEWRLAIARLLAKQTFGRCFPDEL